MCLCVDGVIVAVWLLHCCTVLSRRWRDRCGGARGCTAALHSELCLCVFVGASGRCSLTPPVRYVEMSAFALFVLAGGSYHASLCLHWATELAACKTLAYSPNRLSRRHPSSPPPCALGDASLFAGRLQLCRIAHMLFVCVWVFSIA